LKTLILTAGKIDYTRLPFGMHQSNSTIPVNGKPVISWILDDLIKKDITEIYIVIRKENHRLKQLLEKHYSKRLTLKIVELDNPPSILSSLQAGINAITEPNDCLQVILGDTLIYDSFDGLGDSLLVSEVTNSENWCITKTDKEGNLVGFIDKQKLDCDSHIALCGYYCFSNLTELNNAVDKSIKGGANELSDTLLNYHQVIPLKLKTVETWFDFGHLETFIQSKKSLLRPRHFNQLTIHPLLNTITKVSEKSDKLEDELNWYKLLPESLKILTPRVIEETQSQNKISITQEFYGYPSLSELFIYGDLNISVWESIIDYLFKIHNLFSAYTKQIDVALSKEMYLTKTNERVEQLLKQNTYWEELWNQENIVINGRVYPNINALLEKIKQPLENLTQTNTFSIIHGDYCLSNILYDLNNQIVKLIDPRGSFGEKGIYGDARYDIAKLRHSVVGLYDYIVGDLFQIESNKNTFTYDLFEDEKNSQLARYFDTCVINNGYNLQEIKLIEGLLFLSMIPYHADYFERQQMMYIKSILILSEYNGAT
jgi:dTDP-glucose pyrophosphorylase